MMKRLQNTGLLMVLACLGGSVSAGLLPGGGGGYQYNRPGGPGGSGTNGLFGGGGQRPSGSYGAPGFPGGFGSPGTGFGGGPSITGSGFGGQPSGFQGPSNIGGGYNYNNDNGRPKPYSFQYEVRDPPTGNDFGQQENSDGNTVRGEYRVLLPDSRTQIVRYTADDASGYNADVQYEGQAQFPQFGVAGYAGGPNYQGGFGAGGGGHRGGGIGGGNGSGFGNGGTPNNQYLPPGADYGK
ncbi:acanthoscurrin-1-like isoform X1 [Neodiprion virginianus]|uniref:acanthoscurrin-1-like isoform X1 n=2 Tax=Neodiprion virginianus TaxID=2961670 RepID=UPI001EE6D979|nr:acanthoscurrin-1-like isoform X1 [Neodiprion virginianus]